MVLWLGRNGYINVILKATASSPAFTNNQTHFRDVACLTRRVRPVCLSLGGVLGIKFTSPTIYEVPRPRGKLLTDADAELSADRGGRREEGCEIFCPVMNWAFKMSEASDEKQTVWGGGGSDTHVHGESWSFHSPIFHLTWQHLHFPSFHPPHFCLCSFCPSDVPDIKIPIPINVKHIHSAVFQLQTDLEASLSKSSILSTRQAPYTPHLPPAHTTSPFNYPKLPWDYCDPRLSASKQESAEHMKTLCIWSYMLYDQMHEQNLISDVTLFKQKCEWA